MFVIKGLKIGECFIFASLVIEGTERHKFANFPIVIVGSAENSLETFCTVSSSFSIEHVDGTSNKCSFDGFEKRIPNGVKALPEVDAINLNWDELR